MAYNQEFMEKQTSILRESLKNSGVFADGNDLMMNGQDVYTKSLLERKYEEGVLGGENTEGEIQTLRQLDEVKNYKDQLRRTETSSKLLRGHRMDNLRAMGTEVGDEVKKNAQAEFIREKVLEHIKLLEENNALPEVGDTPELQLQAAFEKKMKAHLNVYEVKDPMADLYSLDYYYGTEESEEEKARRTQAAEESQRNARIRDYDRRAELLKQNQELLKADINFSRRKKYIDVILKPMLMEVSNNTLSSAVIDNLIKSAATLPAQVGITNLIENRVAKHNKVVKLEEERVKKNADRDKVQAEVDRLRAEFDRFERGRGRELKRDKRALENKYREKKLTRDDFRYNSPHSNFLLIDALDDELDSISKKIAKIDKEINSADLELGKAQNELHILEQRLGQIDVEIATNEQNNAWRLGYQNRLEECINDLESERNRNVTLSRNYDELAYELQLTARQDAGDTLLDVYDKWLDRANDRFICKVNNDMENAPERLPLTRAQGKEFAKNFIDELASGILVINNVNNVLNLNYAPNVQVVDKYLLIDGNRILPREGRHNIMRYYRFFAEVDSGLAEYEIDDMTAALNTKLKQMRESGKSEAELENFNKIVGAFIGLMSSFRGRYRATRNLPFRHF